MENINAFNNSETLQIIQHAILLGFEFLDIQEIQDIRFAAEEYINNVNSHYPPKEKKNEKSLEVLINEVNQKYSSNLLGFKVVVQESFTRTIPQTNIVFEKNCFYSKIEEAYSNYKNELEKIFFFDTDADVKDVTLYVVNIHNNSTILDYEHTSFREHPLYARKNKF